MPPTPSRIAQALCGAACALALVGAAPSAAEYAFPITDAYLATVIGTPPALRAPVPERIPVRVRSLELHADRKIPSIFWHERTFHYSVAAQAERAPLVFLIAGTGARYDSEKMVFLQKALYQAGLSVVNITSPTQVDFITTASSSSVPGFMDADVRDLYEAMRRIRAQIEEKVDVSAFYLAGYSLGGTQSAFLGRLDAREGAFGFEKILLINPSVSLYTSARIFDEMLRRSIPGGVPDLQRLVNDL
ncbi:MAG: alpha/beta hydrolase, partial [Deltaproteobacteria bacterium]